MKPLLLLGLTAALVGCTTTTTTTKTGCAASTTAGTCISCCEGEGFSGHNFFVDENSQASCTCEGTSGSDSGS